MSGPYGYIYDKRGRKIPYEPEYKVIQLIIFLRLEKYTFQTIADELNILGITRPNRTKIWEPNIICTIFNREYKVSRNIAFYKPHPDFI